MLNTQKLNKQLDVLENYIAKDNKIAVQVSQASSYWHLDHTLRVVEGVLQSLINSDPLDYSPKYNFLKTLIMITGIIPRGKGRAPKKVVPNYIATPAQMLEQLNNGRMLLNETHKLDKNAFFNHPLFGDLNRDKTIKFIGIHTHHHLKIISDIEKAS